MTRVLATLLALSLTLSAAAATRHNDDSCDIGVLPAATLLLPWFEVDLDDPLGERTLVSITNVTHLDQIARVTLWTDHGYPVFAFNVYLTGYDVQRFDLYDILVRAVIAPDTGTGTAISRRQQYSDINPALDLSECARLPGLLTDADVVRMQGAFTEGRIPGECSEVGGVHANAAGYATIDVVGLCSSALPTDPAYWTDDIRFDNVLIGDYEQWNLGKRAVRGGPLVHIRAVPEGGTPSQRLSSAPVRNPGFPRTFYARYQSPRSPAADGRQPLPSRFATRWIQGGDAQYETSLKIWREGRPGSGAPCAAYAAEDDLAVREIVVFDEQENAFGSQGHIELPAASMNGVDDSAIFPQLANGSLSGWLYLNLDRSRRDDLASQAWVIASMNAQGTYSTDIDAMAMGNGCSAPAGESQVAVAGATPIGPSPNDSGLPARMASTDNDASCDLALLPAATLLLPYFAVDVDTYAADLPWDLTIFTITNVSPHDQIARVTLWTDYAFPVLTFNVFLTGYDVQSISLSDVIGRGIIAPDQETGPGLPKRGPYSGRNRGLDLSNCGALPGQLPEELVAYMKAAFHEGVVPALGESQACNNVGNEHDSAVGYATIDVVSNCSSNGPLSEEYWTEDLAFDNVLIGDFQHLEPRNESAGGAPLVHVRAVPEGGTASERAALPGKYDAGFPYTFYGRYQPAATPRLDGRQPLPSLFAARWQDGGGQGGRTDYKIWREGVRGRSATCPTHDDNVAVVSEIVVFDEAENAVGDLPTCRVTCLDLPLRLPATSRVSSTDTSVIPRMTNGAIAGWVYFNLDNESTADRPRASSNWITASIAFEGQGTIDTDAVALANGCSPAEPKSEITTGVEIIGPGVATDPTVAGPASPNWNPPPTP